MILRPVAPPVEYGITKRLARAGNAAIALPSLPWHLRPRLAPRRKRRISRIAAITTCRIAALEQ
jgi:hypothetical protein